MEPEIRAQKENLGTSTTELYDINGSILRLQIPVELLWNPMTHLASHVICMSRTSRST